MCWPCCVGRQISCRHILSSHDTSSQLFVLLCRSKNDETGHCSGSLLSERSYCCWAALHFCLLGRRQSPPRDRSKISLMLCCCVRCLAGFPSSPLFFSSSYFSRVQKETTHCIAALECPRNHQGYFIWTKSFERWPICSTGGVTCCLQQLHWSPLSSIETRQDSSPILLDYKSRARRFSQRVSPWPSGQGVGLICSDRTVNCHIFTGCTVDNNILCGLEPKIFHTLSR